MHGLPIRRLTEEEYLSIERAAEFKSEYLDGQMYSMAGAGLAHARIISNISGSLYAQFRGRPCGVFTNDMRVRVADSGLYTYPDVIALCGEPRLADERRDTLLNPQLIVEVLSPSTQNYDRGEKFRRYRQLESLTDYILVAQEEMLVEHWSLRGPSEWAIREYRDPADRVRIEALECGLVLGEIYDKVEFPSTELPPR